MNELVGQVKRRDGEIALVVWVSTQELMDLLDAAKERGEEELAPMVRRIIADDLYR